MFEDIRRDDEGLVEIGGESYYRIVGVDRMSPFLMSVVSDGDRWMFVSSGGALTAGRRDASQALFPYETDDRLHQAGNAIGPSTRLRVVAPHQQTFWEPFATRPQAETRRSIAKAVLSEAVVFEEQHVGLGLTFSYRWGSAERFGFVRTVTLRNDSRERVEIDAIDGLVDLVPYGLEPAVQQQLSNLSNAYKRSEIIDRATRLAAFTLEAPVSDTAEPEEVLRATVVWSTGLDGAVDLDASSLAAFETGQESEPQHLLTGRPGSYLLHGALSLEPGESATWHIVADVGRDHVDVVDLRHWLEAAPDPAADLESAVRETGRSLARIMARADAEQLTGDAVACAHHASNVTYNVMRGGVPLDGYLIDTNDFAEFMTRRNRRVAGRCADWQAELPDSIERRDLLGRIADTGDVHLGRLGDEYLPFSFSRRHGDPSRPWNQFSIRVTGPDDEPLIYFEGNWRDVFQNWEALCASFPEYLPSVVSLFVNASTADGHNPYRITRDGIDWEVPDPDDPWANIGYWGDHQIVYLLRLLEATDAFLPGEIERRLTARSCTYADVPYRIAPYAELVRDPKSTIEYDVTAEARSSRRVAEIGADGKMLVGDDGDVVLVTLAEKLLVAVLAKLSNFVPGGGIWLNTQRPEWNDANNALVGYGLSMVTLFHLRRFLDVLRNLISSVPADLEISSEVAIWLDEIIEVLGRGPIDDAGEHDVERRTVMDRLGEVASAYRTTIYEAGFSGVTTSTPPARIVELCDLAIGHLDVSIRSSRRSDGLVDSYNLIRFTADDQAAIQHLPPMLEGQVAALTRGLLTPHEQADLLDDLFESELYRADQQSFVLAPPRRPPAFLDKNVVDPDAVAGNPLLVALVEAGERSVIHVDADGVHRFAAELGTEPQLSARLDELAAQAEWVSLVEAYRPATLDVYEMVFGHRSYLGRSGSMYAYEGIGSIYWHMVTKLLLAVQEACSDAERRDAAPEDLERLVSSYRRVRAGLGFNKSAEEFGAVPIDPYSHTPSHAGAQQPGMTGAVKEEILARPRELGVHIEDGRVVFDSLLLQSSELLDRAQIWSVRTSDGGEISVDLDAGMLGLTLCQVPVTVAATTGEPSVMVEFADGSAERHRGDRLDAATSAAVFGRTGEVTKIRADVRIG